LERLNRDTKGVSLIVTTLLLIAVAVAASGVTFSWIMAMVDSQSIQVQTRVMIDMVNWDMINNSVKVTVRNIGSVDASIVSLSLMMKDDDDNVIYDIDDLPLTIQVGEKTDIIWDEGNLDYLTLYIIKVTTSTGFYNEYLASTPKE
jgi:FlaG/FlaF family flagellin (archaellin)